jgi:hypothetical protein
MSETTLLIRAIVRMYLSNRFTYQELVDKYELNNIEQKELSEALVLMEK